MPWRSHVSRRCEPRHQGKDGWQIMSDRLVVLNKDEDTVSFIDVGTGDTLGSVKVGSHPHEVAFSPDGDVAYVSNAMGNSISVISSASMEESERFEHPEFRFPHDVKIRLFLQ